MSRIQELFNLISLDLNIRRYSCEPENLYFSRLIYSAIGCWVLYCIGDKNVEEDKSRYGVSKNYINRRCSKILNDFLEIYPKAKDWFFTNDITDCSDVIKFIRGIYEYLGYLVPADSDSSLTLPKLRNVVIEDGLVFYRGISKVSKMIGLGTYEFINEAKKENVEHLFEMFLIPNKRADIFVQDYLRKAKWTTGNVSEDIKFFDYKSKNSLSGSWTDKWTEDTITIYKNGYIDYGLVKFVAGKCYSSQFPDYIVSEKEVRRFMYGFKYINEVYMKARLKRFSDVAVLRLFSRLPKRETALLRVLSWPVNNMQDMYYYYIPIELINVIKSILENLCIKVEEI